MFTHELHSQSIAPIPPHKLESFIDEMVLKANMNNAQMDGTTVPVKRIIERADIVLGLWKDYSLPCGVGVYVIKGARRLRETFAGSTQALRVDAICCLDPEQAVAAGIVLGDRSEDELSLN